MIVVMKKVDLPSVDGDLLNKFILVLETRSEAKATKRLGRSQSNVRHALRRLREFFENSLFVGSRQSLVPTERTEALKAPVKRTVFSSQKLNREHVFDPTNSHLQFAIAANDFQCGVVFPQLVRELIKVGISVSFEFVPSGQPCPEMMRNGTCDSAFAPFPPIASDILQKQLFKARMVVYVGGAIQEAPLTWEECCEADRITVQFADGGRSQRALNGLDKSGVSNAKIAAPDFVAISSFVKGTRMIATELVLMKLCTFKDLDAAPLPRKSAPVQMFMTWHRRNDQRPGHIWPRSRIERIAIKAWAQLS